MIRSRSKATPRALTFVEVAMASAVFSIVILGIAGLFRSSTETSGLVHAQSDVQLEAERVLRRVRDELRLSGVGGTGDLQLNLATQAPVAWELSYRRLSATGPLFDPTKPSHEKVPWSPGRFVLRFERIDDPADGQDNDGDLLIDEGRVALYRTPPGGGAEVLVGVLGRDIADFHVAEETGARTRVRLKVTVERVLRTALRTNQDVAAAKAGGGPRVSHSADIWLTIPN